MNPFQRPRGSCRDYLLLSRLYCRLWNYTRSCASTILSTRGLYHRSGIHCVQCHPAPKVRYLVVFIITYLCFDDAIYGANFNALGGIKVTFAFDTGSCVNDIQSAIAFGDGIGGTFGQACAAGDAFF